MQVVSTPSEILSYVTRFMFGIFQVEDGYEKTGETEAYSVSKSVHTCYQN